MITRILQCVAVGAIILLAGCAGGKSRTGTELEQTPQNYAVEANTITLANGPTIRVNEAFHYSGAEIVPALGSGVKRQIFAGPGGAFLTVSVFDASSQAVREAVSAPANPKWEYRIKEITGPARWVRVAGNKTPCCVNLLYSEYIFVPAGGVWQKENPLPAGNVPGKVVLISYGKPIPEELSPNYWVADGGTAFLEDSPKLDYEPDASGLLIPGLSPDKLTFLAEQDAAAAAAYRVE